MKAVELFAGAGGLALGVGLGGFQHAAVIEWDPWACETLRANQERSHPLVAGWPLHQGDVRKHDFSATKDAIDLVAGGPPCQPFSMGGKHGAHLDKRDMFPTTVDVIRALRPRAFLIENVKGLTRDAFRNYFEYIRLQLKRPCLVKQKQESITDHMARLEKCETSGTIPELAYDVVARVLNAADYGIPQRRERVFLVGFRHDLGIEWSFPEATHSLDALLYQQYVTNEYWEHHGIPKSRRPKPTQQLLRRAEMLRLDTSGYIPGMKPWRTVRDALQGLPDPEGVSEDILVMNHKYQPGAKSYPGHTGSPLDLPAKTLKAGVHGVPGGENMMVKPNGSVRYFTVRESARLQTFPDGYIFHGSWSETMRQLGNAVPVALARLIASSIAETLIEADISQLRKNDLELVLQ